MKAAVLTLAILLARGQGRDRALAEIAEFTKTIMSDPLTTDTQPQNFLFYEPTPEVLGLSGSISLESSVLGIDFVTVKLELTGEFKWWQNASLLIYFQIEQPSEVAPETRLRLLNIEEPWYEGWIGAIETVDGNLLLNLNSWGQIDLSTEDSELEQFGGNTTALTNATSTWQLLKSELRLPENETDTGTLAFEVQRIASILDEVNFKILNNQAYKW